MKTITFILVLLVSVATFGQPLRPMKRLLDEFPISMNTDLPTALTAASAAGGGMVQIPYGTTTLTSALTIPSNCTVWGFDDNSIIDISGIDAATAITMSKGSALIGVQIAGDSTDYDRQIVVGTDCYVERVYINSNGGGFYSTTDSNMIFKDVKFKDIYDTEGWAACINLDSVVNARIDGVFAEDCDRGIEIENGSRDIWVSNGYMENIATGNETYNFVLNAHTHVDAGVVSNIHFDNFYLKNCERPISANGVAGKYVSDVSFKNIVIDSTTSDVHVIRLEYSRNVLLDNIVLKNPPTAVSTTVYGEYSDHVIMRGLHFTGAMENYIFDFDNSLIAPIIENSFFERDSGTGYTVVLDCDTPGLVFNNNVIKNFTSYGGLSTSAGDTAAIISNNKFFAPASGAGNFAIHLASNHNQVFGNLIWGNVARGIDVNGGDYNVVRNNWIEQDVIRIRAGSTGNQILFNQASIENLGTSTVTTEVPSDSSQGFIIKSQDGVNWLIRVSNEGTISADSTGQN